MRKFYKKKKLCGILFILTALIIMQLPVAEADAAASASDFKIEGSVLVKYRGTETNVSVPDTVEVIGEGAFEGNTSVELVVLPNSVKRIEAYAFWGCDSLDTVVLGTGLKEVGDLAFANCKGLLKMTIPVNVQGIGMQAFTDCVNLKDISIPPETTFIHETAFDGCYKLLIHCDEGTAADKFAKEFYEKQKEMPEYEDVPDYGEYEEEPDEGNDTITAPALPENKENFLGSTQVVGNQAVVFIDNTSPKVLSGSVSKPLPEYEKQIGAKYTIIDGKTVADQAYYRNMELGSIILPDGIEEVGQFSFARSSVKKVILPEGVKTVSYGAFYHCDQLESVSLPETVLVVEPKAFDHTAWVNSFLAQKFDGSENDFLISGEVLVAYRGNKAAVQIPEGVRVIAGEAFAGHKELHSVTLPNSLISVGEGAFEGCSGLSEILFGEQASLENIKDRAFKDCAIKELILPVSVKKLGVKAFDKKVRLDFAAGQEPELTHEISAERLSNESYRDLKKTAENPGVSVVGLPNSYAELEGAARHYTLTMEALQDSSLFQSAYMRSMQTALPEHTAIYEPMLCDSSQIPLSKLGKQLLTVTLPVPESLSMEEIIVYMADRNGQLEVIPSGRVFVDGVESIRFTVHQLYVFGLCGTGEPCDEGEVLEETTNLQQMSAPVKESFSNLLMVKYLIGGAFLLTGALLLFIRTKKKNRN